MTDDDLPYDTLLNLEDQYHRQGYDEGYRDGEQKGRMEGHSVGFKAGFDMFFEVGSLAGQAAVWADLGAVRNTVKDQITTFDTTTEIATPAILETPAILSGLEGPPATRNSRAKILMHAADLYTLIRPDALSIENTDQAIIDLDDRLKHAQGKARLIESMVGQCMKPPALGIRGNPIGDC